MHNAQSYKHEDSMHNAQSYTHGDTMHNAQSCKRGDAIILTWIYNAQSYTCGDTMHNAQSYTSGDTMHYAQSCTHGDTMHNILTQVKIYARIQFEILFSESNAHSIPMLVFEFILKVCLAKVVRIDRLIFRCSFLEFGKPR